jgi:hypothetical protein
MSWWPLLPSPSFTELKRQSAEAMRQAAEMEKIRKILKPNGRGG